MTLRYTLKAIRNNLLRTLPECISHPMVRKQVSPLTDLSPEYEIKVAQTKEELRDAFLLVNEAYREKGLAEEKDGIWLTTHHALPSSNVFIVMHHGKVVATATHVGDSPLGLPADGLSDLSNLRSGIRQLAEISSLAIKKGYRGTSVLFHLTRYMYHYSLNCGVDTWVMATHPDAAIYYQALFGFKKIDGIVHQYNKVRGAKAFTQLLNLHEMHELYATKFRHHSDDHRFYKFYFEDFSTASLPQSSHEFHASIYDVAPPENIDYFFNQATDQFSRLDSDQLEILRQLYPTPLYECVFPKAHQHSGHRKIRDGFRYLNNCKAMVVVPNNSMHESSTSPLAPSGHPIFIFGRLTDISTKGAKIRLTQKLQENQASECKLYIQISPKHKLELKAQIKWHSKTGEVGVEFSDTSHPLFYKFMEFVANPYLIAADKTQINATRVGA